MSLLCFESSESGISGQSQLSRLHDRLANIGGLAAKPVWWGRAAALWWLQLHVPAALVQNCTAFFMRPLLLCGRCAAPVWLRLSSQGNLHVP